MKKTGLINRIVYSRTVRVLVFSLLSVLIALSLWFYHKLNQSQKQRYLSYIAADELRQSSDDLTRMVRTYVMTKDPRYEEMYWDILAIRNGQKARPIRYENIYWDFMASTNEKPRPDGQKISLLEMMKDLGFTQEELAKLARAETHSNDLVRIEEIAMHAMKGEFLDAEGEFTIKREPDYDYARAILYDESYHREKVDIMTPIDEFFVMVNARTEARVKRDTIGTYICVSLVFATIILLLCFSRVELNERKQAEEALEIEGYRLAKAQEIGSIGTWELDIVKNVLTWTKENYNIFGIPDGADLTYETFLECVHPDDREYVDVEWMAGVDGKPYDIEHRVIANGQVKWVREKAELLLDNDGKAIRAVGVTQDITGRKKAEENLSRAEERYRSLVSIMTSVVWVTDTEGKFVDRQSMWEEFTGQKWEEHKEWGWANMIHPDDRGRVKHLWADAVKNKTIYCSDGRIMRANGNYCYFEAVATPILDDRGRFKEWVGTITDISERKKSEKELEEHRAELAHAWRMSTMGEMASGIAHELNQPLCAILNYANACTRIMKGQPDESGKITDTLQDISSQTERAGEIIRRLRTLVVKGKPLQSTVCINDIVEEVVNMESAEAKEKSISIYRELADDLPSVFADSIQLEQVILNLVRNAFDAMDDVPCDKRHLTIRASVRQDSFIELAVSDTGVGLSSEVEQKLFEPFFTSKPKGLGIGLSLSQSIIDTYGGKLWAESNQDGGATFRFILPVKTEMGDGDIYS